MKSTVLSRLAPRAACLLACAVVVNAATAQDQRETLQGADPFHPLPQFYDAANGFAPGTWLRANESFTYLDNQGVLRRGADSLDHFAAAPQSQALGWSCVLCDAVAPGASTGYLAAADAAGLHAGAAAWQMDAHNASIGVAHADVDAEMGDMIHLDQAATVHFQGYVDGLMQAERSRSQTSLGFSLGVFDPATVRNAEGAVVDSFADYRYEAWAGGVDSTDTASGPHAFSFDLSLPAGDTFLLMSLGVMADAQNSLALADFSHTAHLELSVPDGVQATSALGLIPISPVPEPDSLSLAGAGLALLAGLQWRRRA